MILNNRSIFLGEWATDNCNPQKNQGGKMCEFLTMYENVMSDYLRWLRLTLYDCLSNNTCY